MSTTMLEYVPLLKLLFYNMEIIQILEKYFSYLIIVMVAGSDSLAPGFGKGIIYLQSCLPRPDCEPRGAFGPPQGPPPS